MPGASVRAAALMLEASIGFAVASLAAGALGSCWGFQLGEGSEVGCGKFAVGRSGSCNAGIGFDAGIAAGVETAADGVAAGDSGIGATAGLGAVVAVAAGPADGFSPLWGASGAPVVTDGTGACGWTKWNTRLPATPTATA